MSNDEWDDNYEEDGVTLGPEEALQREIQKSKSLKIDKLQLRNEVEKLQLEVHDLTLKVHMQEQELTRVRLKETPKEQTNTQNQAIPSNTGDKRQIPRFLVLFILFFNILAISLLLYFKLQK
ncbi:MAG: hypothetical protein ACQ9MH_08865 [Nitrospinales bacterium]